MPKTSITFLTVALMLTALSGQSCQNGTTQTQVSKPATQPAEQPTTREKPAESPPPVATQPTTSKPEATQPAPPALPASTFDSKPPYPVELHVRSPEDKQPGWLRVLGLADKEAAATVKGVFPEQNRIVIDTQNVNRLAMQISYLPLAEKKRILLRIDNQGIELLRGNRRTIVLQRKRTGEWSVDQAATK